MLVLSRKRSERIVIGSVIRITVVKLEGNQVRIGIEAPDDLAVLRAELVRVRPARDVAGTPPGGPPPVRPARGPR